MIIKDVSFQLKNEIRDLILIIGTITSGKPSISVTISESAVNMFKLHAGEIVKAAAKEFNGGGGGQPFFASASGKEPQNLGLAMKKAEEIIMEKLMKVN